MSCCEHCPKSEPEKAKPRHTFDPSDMYCYKHEKYGCDAPKPERVLLHRRGNGDAWDACFAPTSQRCWVEEHRYAVLEPKP